MKKKNYYVMIVVYIMAGMLIGCAKQPTKKSVTVELLRDANPTTSALSLWEYDGTDVTGSWLYDAKMEQELIDMINSQSAVLVDEIDVNSLTGSLYGIEIGGKDGKEVLGAWKDGYWFADDGKVYQVDLEFDQMKEKYSWEDTGTFSLLAFPNIYQLALTEGSWNSSFLTKSKEIENQGLELEIINRKDTHMNVKLKNVSNEEMTYGEYISVQVNIDGTWYDIPPKENMAFIDIAYLLEAGEEVEKEYDISFYGELPAGSYRFLVAGSAVEFTTPL